jgi:hypothetical protein
MGIILPTLPVLLNSSVRNPFTVPPVSVPNMVSVVHSPSRVYVEIKDWDPAIIDPFPVIIKRTVPTTFPQTPPEAVPEKQVHIDMGDNVDIRLGYHNHLGWRGKYDGRRQRKTDVYIDSCHRWKRNDDY